MKRTTITLGDETADFLDDYCKRLSCSQGEAVRRMAAIMKFVEEKQSKSGSGILYQENGVIREVVFLV